MISRGRERCHLEKVSPGTLSLGLHTRFRKAVNSHKVMHLVAALYDKRRARGVIDGNIVVRCSGQRGELKDECIAA